MPLPGAFPSLSLAPLLPHRHLQSSAATGNRTCCGEIAQKTGMSFGLSVNASLCWRLGLQNTLVVHLSLDQAAAPAWRGLAPQEQVGTDRTGTQGHCCPLSLHTHPRPLHAASLQWRSPGCTHGRDDPQPGWHRSQSAFPLFKDFHLRISCQPKVTDNRVMTRICWNTLRLCFSTLGC